MPRAAVGRRVQLCRHAIRRCCWGQRRIVAIQPGGARPDVPHIERAEDKGLYLGEDPTCWAACSLQGGDCEALRESAQGRRAVQLAQEPGCFHQLSHGRQDGGEMAARLGWVMVGATRGDTTTSRVKREGGTMRGNVQPANVLRCSVVTRGDATSSRDKQEGGGMRGKVTMSWHVERRWRQ